jgi:hypothetical protein
MHAAAAAAAAAGDGGGGGGATARTSLFLQLECALILEVNQSTKCSDPAYVSPIAALP